MEDKQEICNLLCKTLQKTRCASDLMSLYYDKECEEVIATFVNGKVKINVAMDSGTAMIRDIMRRID